MRVPLSWLSEHVDVDVPVATLADKLTFAGIEIETIHRVGDERGPLDTEYAAGRLAVPGVSGRAGGSAGVDVPGGEHQAELPVAVHRGPSRHAGEARRVGAARQR